MPPRYGYSYLRVLSYERCVVLQEVPVSVEEVLLSVFLFALKHINSIAILRSVDD